MTFKEVSLLSSDQIFEELKAHEESLRKADSLNDSTSAVVKRCYELSAEYKRRLAEIKESLGV